MRFELLLFPSHETWGYDMKATQNKHESRESWLAAAARLIRPHFSACGYEIPEKMRFAIAFPSTGRKGKRVGELWHAATSTDGTCELIIRADLDQPPDVLAVLVHQLVHSVLPPDAGHGPLFKEAAQKIGLTGKMRDASPSRLLLPILSDIAEQLGPLPHAALLIERGPKDQNPADRPKKQGTRLLKAACNCGYTVRITGKWVNEVGPPLCPKHGAMTVDLPPDDDEESAAPLELAEAV